jgi:hypothetical protein
MNPLTTEQIDHAKRIARHGNTGGMMSELTESAAVEALQRQKLVAFAIWMAICGAAALIICFVFISG